MGTQLKFIRYPISDSVSKESVVTIGNFDGIHKGHQALINQVTTFAKDNGLESIVVSMQPLASQYFAGKENIAILTPFKCKYSLIKNLQVDTFCVLNFNKALSEISAESFIQNILLNDLNAKHIVIGDDFKFGKNRQGDFNFLKSYCQTKNVSVANIDSVSDNSIRVSSSAIRTELSLSNFDTVKSYLGRRFSIAGKISRGQQIGRTLDFPTINIKLAKRVLPLKGIFCVKVMFETGDMHLGSASIGTRPTVNGKGIILEVHLLDFNKQVYGQNVEVFFYHKIRNEVKFEGLEELKRHIKQDVIKTRLFFKNKTINNT
jgi:riboflavin kinase/FMN adenylyltransferase